MRSLSVCFVVCVVLLAVFEANVEAKHLPGGPVDHPFGGPRRPSRPNPFPGSGSTEKVPTGVSSDTWGPFNPNPPRGEFGGPARFKRGGAVDIQHTETTQGRRDEVGASWISRDKNTQVRGSVYRDSRGGNGGAIEVTKRF